MAYFATAYDTTAQKAVNTQKVVASAITALVNENFVAINNQTPGIDLPIYTDGCTPSLVTTMTDSEMSIPVFAHPLYVSMQQLRGSSNESYLLSDARGYMGLKPLDHNGKLTIKGHTEFDFVRYRTLLSAWWYKGNIDSFKYLSPILISIYSKWLSESISRRFGLDPQDQLLISILSAYFYQSLFYSETFFDESITVKMAKSIAQATYADIELVLDVMDQAREMKDLHDLCKAIVAVTDNPRLSDFNAPLLITLIATSWFGSNAREIAAVALEHIPTFITMVYSCLTDRGYGKTPIAKTVEKFKGSKGGDHFVLSLKSLLNQIQEG